MLQWQAVFGILLVEIFICTVVILPLPLSYRKYILQGIDKLTKHQTVSTLLKVVFILLAFLFIDCVRSAYKEEDFPHNAPQSGHSHGSHSEYLSRLFRAQRNAYAFFLY